MTAEPIRRQARAKINLTLHVTGQREDGYHLLDSLVAFADCADLIEVRPAPALTLSVDGPMRAGVPVDERNLVLKAAALFGTARGAEIQLSKYLPNAAGIGGGSADAAACLHALAKLWNMPLPDNLHRIGADVPVCLMPSALRMRCIGEQLDPVPRLPDLWAVLVNPGEPVHTPDVFRALSVKDNAPMEPMPEGMSTSDFLQWCKVQRNDLQAPAIGIAPGIEAALEALAPAKMARMSGSGATCFGLCESLDAAEQLAQHISADHPEWWVQATRLR